MNFFRIGQLYESFYLYNYLKVKKLLIIFHASQMIFFFFLNGFLAHFQGQNQTNKKYDQKKTESVYLKHTYKKDFLK